MKVNIGPYLGKKRKVTTPLSRNFPSVGTIRVLAQREFYPRFRSERGAFIFHVVRYPFRCSNPCGWSMRRAAALGNRNSLYVRVKAADIDQALEFMMNYKPDSDSGALGNMMFEPFHLVTRRG
jgi:hypothetical protein